VQWTWGKTHELAGPLLGRSVLKTSPSGGARHTIEVYPLVLRVQDVPSGLHHYSVARNDLELVRAGDLEQLAVALCGAQEWVQDAAAVFFMTSIVERSAWKYRHPHAYRVVHLDAGHLGQTFHLVCAELGLAPFTTTATNAAGIEQALGLDGISEVAVYTAATGYPARA
jgi:SagB-type dehydrogenase family enzyme